MDFDTPKELLSFRLGKSTTFLAKTLIEFLEDLQERQEINFGKATDSLSEEEKKLIYSMVCISDEEFAMLRKRILDKTNDTFRDFQKEISNFTIRFNLRGT